ncbi:hypothetical protein C8R42DRAFT_719597 [Lentinula raphanica]|nr:hypothetical protein C8R42DRAFT_719597 [Lentinula raphanica]
MQGVTLAQLEIRPTQPGMLLAHPGMQPATLPPPDQPMYPANQLAQSGEQPHPGPQPGQSVHPHHKLQLFACCSSSLLTAKAHSFHPAGSEPVMINLHLNRKNIVLKPQDGWDKPDIGTEKLSLQAGDYFSISLPPAYSSLNKGGRHVSSVVYGPGLGGTKHLPRLE